MWEIMGQHWWNNKTVKDNVLEYESISILLAIYLNDFDLMLISSDSRVIWRTYLQDFLSSFRKSFIDYFEILYYFTYS